MIDDPRKTSELIATLQNAAPFAVDLSPQLVATLKTKSTDFDAASRYAVTEVSMLETLVELYAASNRRPVATPLWSR